MLFDREIFKRPVSLEEHYQPPAKLWIVPLPAAQAIEWLVNRVIRL